MTQLFDELLGWLGYLQRSAVVVQLLGVIAMAVLASVVERRWLGALQPRWQRLLKPMLTPLLMGLWAVGLDLVGQLNGLVVFLLWWRIGWSAIGLLHPLLSNLLEPVTLYDLETRLLRPAFLVAAGIATINQLDNLGDVASISLGQLFRVEVTLGNLAVALGVTYLVVVASSLPAALAAWSLKRLLGTSESSRKAMELILRYTVVGLGVLAVGIHLGINPTAMIAVAGGLSVGLGFGIKEIFSNFISGIWLLFEGSVRPGEVLIINDDACEVRRLGLRATVLWRDRDNAEVLIPNQMFFTDEATTYTGTDRLRRSEVKVGAAYHHDPATVMSLLQQTAASVPGVLPEPAPKALLMSYGDSAINYSVRFWIAHPMDNVGICSAVHTAIWRAFKAEDIEIPFPQQVQYPMAWPPEAQQGFNGAVPHSGRGALPPPTPAGPPIPAPATGPATGPAPAPGPAPPTGLD